MGNFDSSDVKEAIRNNSDIVEIVSDYVLLKKSGANLSALCPFHSEKTPSFSVSPSKQIFHCFGCGAGGDVFTFICKIENFSFFEALEFLGKKCGIEIPKSGHKATDQALKNQIYDVNKRAAEFYRNCLLKSSEGRLALAYLEKRGISQATISRFMIGYAGLSWDGLQKHLATGNFPVAMQEKAGLIRKNDSGKSFRDRFRGRIMFPIFEGGGEIVGFGGRVLKSDENRPKYLNSPETSVYKKAGILYGLNFAKEFIRESKEAIIVEGYMDLISLNQAGVGNVIAVSGTALTGQHVKLIKRYTDSVVLVFDGDRAGVKAAKKGCLLLADSGVKVRIVEFTDGMDPDSYIRENGKDVFCQTLKKSPPYMEFIVDNVIKLMADQSINEKVKAIETLLPYLSKISNAVEKGHYLSMIAGRLSVSESSILEEFNKIKREEKAIPVTEVKPIGSISKAEKILIQLALKDFTTIEKIKEKAESNEFEDPDIRIIIATLYDMSERGEPDTGSLLNSLTSERARRIVTEFSMEELSYSEADETIEDCLRDIWRKKESLPAQWKVKNSKSERIKFLRDQLGELKKNDSYGIH